MNSLGIAPPNELVDEQQAMFLVEAPLAALARYLLCEFVELVDRTCRACLRGPRSAAAEPSSFTWPYCPRPPDCLMCLFFAFGQFQNRFAIGDLRAAHVRLHAEFAHHAVNDNFKVKLAHSGNQRLPRIYIGVHAERGIFLRQLRKAPSPFFPGRRLSLARSLRK